MTLVYSGVPGLDVPGGAVPGLAYIPAGPPTVLPRGGVVSITSAGPLAAQVTIGFYGPLTAAVSIAAGGPLAAEVTISQPS